MKKKKKKLVFNSLRDERIRSTIIMAFYIALFLVLIINIKTNKNSDIVKKEEKNNLINSIEDVKKYLDSNNFSFTYVLKIDDQNYIYMGKKYDYKSKFSYQRNIEKDNYYQSSKEFYIEKNDDYVRTDNPFQYFDFSDSSMISKLITESSYNKRDNIYEINNVDFSKVIKGKDILKNKNINTIDISFTDSDIVRVTIDFTNYVKEIEDNHNLIVLDLEYRDFGKIADFQIEE